MTRVYVDREATVAALAPVAPPCFGSRDQWVTYLQAAASEQREHHAAGPLLIRKGQPVVFNRDYAFCADCTQTHSYEMWEQGRCNKDWLLQLIPPDPPSERFDLTTLIKAPKSASSLAKPVGQPAVTSSDVAPSRKRGRPRKEVIASCS